MFFLIFAATNEQVMEKKVLHKMIEEGEHLHQDFKFAITDSKKIARSLVAFANTEGGSLLIGVKDNGNIAGVYSDEEYYMIEAASSMYCLPPVPFETKEWFANGKTVLEVMVNKSAQRPHKAPDKDGNYMAYVRVEDKNLMANKILLKVWKRKQQPQGTLLTFSKSEKFLLNYLNQYPLISFSKFRRLAKIPPYKAEKILVNFIAMDIVSIHITEKTTYYSLHKEATAKIEMPA